MALFTLMRKNEEVMILQIDVSDTSALIFYN